MTKQVQRRRGTATQHTSFTGAEGELSVNTTNKSVHVHDGVTTGGIEAARADMTNVSDADLNARLAGNTLSSLTITSADINGGTIDGTVIGGASAAAVTVTSLIATSSATLQHSASTKLATTSTGIDVTGTVTADGLTVDGNLGVGLSAPSISEGYQIHVDAAGNGVWGGFGNTYLTSNYKFNSGNKFAGTGYAQTIEVVPSTGAFTFKTSSASGTADATATMQSRMNIATNGDISFYEDTGTTPKFFWDASAESLGIGTSSPGAELELNDSVNSTSALRLRSMGGGSNGSVVDIVCTGTGIDQSSLSFYTRNTALTERMTITSSGNVGIGTSSPSYALDVKDVGESWVRADSSTTTNDVGFRFAHAGVNHFVIYHDGDADFLGFYDNVTSTERMRIDSSGRVGIGSISPDEAGLVIHTSGSEANTSARLALKSNETSADTYLRIGRFGTGDDAGMTIANNYARNQYGYIADYLSYGVASVSFGDGVLSFNTAAAGNNGPLEAMRIDSSGNVGIGRTPATAARLAIRQDDATDYSSTTYSNTHLYLQNGANNSGGFAGIEFGPQTDNGTAVPWQVGAVAGAAGTYNSYFVFKHRTGASTYAEAIRIHEDGETTFGKTVADNTTVGTRISEDGYISSVRNGSSILLLNRLTSHGNIITLRKDSLTIGEIDSYADDLVIGTGNCKLRFEDAYDTINPRNSDGTARDNLVDLGASSVRFDDVYATNGAIQTSDANEKQQIADLTTAEMQAATAISKLFKTFKWNDSVAEKGDDARIHSGVIAQDVEAAMTDAGLDAGKYAFFISSTWWESTEVIPAVEEVLDEDGNVVTEAQAERTVTHQHDTAEEAPEGAVERNRKGIRYPQLLSFIGAATEQRLASIEARLDAANL